MPRLTRFNESDASRSTLRTEAVASSTVTMLTSPSDCTDIPELKDSTAPPVSTLRLEVARSMPPPTAAVSDLPMSSSTLSPTATSAPSTSDSLPAPPLRTAMSPDFTSRSSVIATEAPPLPKTLRSVVEATML